MLENFKITLMVKDEKIDSLNLTKSELNILNLLVEEKYVENLNISLKSMRRKGFCFFVDFESTNEKTIKENLNSFLEKDYVEEIDLNFLILEEFKKIA